MSEHLAAWRPGAAMLLILLSPIAGATPDISGTWIGDLHTRSLYGRSEGDDGWTNVYLDGSALETTIGFNKEIEGFVNIVFEPVEDGNPNADNFFQRHGIFAQELTLAWRRHQWSLYGGKFNANFGRAWNLIPGIYRKMLAGAYEFTENIGIGAGVTLDAGSHGAHHVELSTFFTDTTELSHSLITDRGRLSQRSGGPGNTGGLDSYALSMDGEQMEMLPGFNYHVAYSDLAAGNGSPERQRGFVASADYTHAFTSELDLLLALEAAYFSGWEGADVESTFITPAAELRRGPWSAIAVWSMQHFGGDGTDRFLELTGSYQFGNGLRAYLGWAQRQIDGEEDHEIGVRIYYRHEF